MDGSGAYANGIASATGNYHARLVVDPATCNYDTGGPPYTDCWGPYTFWNAIYTEDGVTTAGSNMITSATANFTAADVGLAVQATDISTGDPIFSPGTTITSVTNATTAVVSTNAMLSSSAASLNIFPLFSLGYITEAAIYLDVSWAAGNPDARFDWDSALGDNAQNYDSDYVFNVGTQTGQPGDTTPGFWVSTSPNAFRNSTYPENPCPNPSSGFGNYCRAPVEITTSGWYTFRHIFKVDQNTQNLSVEFQVVPLGGGTPLVDTTIYGWQNNQQAPPGGISPDVGWFANQEIPELAIDNTLLKDFDTLTLSPTNPPPLGLGTIQTFILSASLFGVPDPLTPGLTPANVNFTQGGTGSVTVVPSGTQPNNGTFSFDATGATDGSVNLTGNIDIFPSNAASFNVIQPSLYSPANGSTLTGSSVTFYWTEYPGATAYWLDLGSAQGGNNYAQTGSLSGSTLSYTVNNLPTDGSIVYATWYYYVNGSWQYSQYSYTAYSSGGPKGVITIPANGSTLTGSTVNFTWTPGNGATNYWIDAGSTQGGNDYFQSGALGNVTTETVTGLPTNGSQVYVTLFTYVGGQWVYNQYQYTAYTQSSGPPAVSFLPAVTYATGGGPDAIAAGDFRGIGKFDLAVANYNDNTVSVLLGNGDGTFATAATYAVGSGPAWIAVGDFNGDGHLDMAVANAGGGVSILLGNGDGTFQSAVNYPAGPTPYVVATADFNGDGKLDLAVADNGGGVAILLGNGNGTFQAPVYYAAGNNPYSLAVGDFRSNGKLDLAVVNETDNTVSILLGNGDGTFQTAVNYGGLGGQAYQVVVGDFNGDNKPDLAVSSLGNNTVNIFIGNGDGTFQAAVNYPAGSGPQGIALADFNGDGHVDLAVADYLGSTVGVLLGVGNGTFTSPTTFGVGNGPLVVTARDFNRDGKPDLAVANYNDNDVSILLNNTAFSGPAIIEYPAPNSTLTGSTVTFHWTASDPATNFWIDVGSVPGGNDYYQSGSLPNTTHSATVSGLPTNGSAVYATMWSLIGGQWVYNSYTYTAFTPPISKGVITSPMNYSMLSGSSQPFIWTAGSGATAYWLTAGNSPGGNNYYNSGNLGNVLTTTATGLPTDGSTVYVTLFTYTGGQWVYNQYQYTAFTGSGSLAVMQTPTPGSVLGGNSATFTWSAGNGANNYWLDVGSYMGGHDYYQSGPLGNVLTTTVNTLPANSTTIYVTLWTYVGGQWLYNQYTYFSTVAFQGFETGVGDWNPTLDSYQNLVTTTYQVPSGGGYLQLQAASGNYYAEVHNIDNDYCPFINGNPNCGWGDSGVSFFGYGPGGGQAPASPPPFPGNFSQSIKMYINASWPQALYDGPGVWIDETPGNFIPTVDYPYGNFGAEHNFRLTPTGTSVEVFVDGQGSPIATITTSGWYNFQFTFQQSANCNNEGPLALTVANVYDPSKNLIGTTTVCGDSPGGPQNSSDLAGPGYVWITVWPDGWANDVLGIDDVEVDLLH